MLNLSEARKQQLDYIGITSEDLTLLQSKEPIFKEVVDTLVDELYERIMQRSELKRIIEAHSTVERLKETQRWYFLSLATGTIDNEFIEKKDFYRSGSFSNRFNDAVVFRNVFAVFGLGNPSFQTDDA